MGLDQIGKSRCIPTPVVLFFICCVWPLRPVLLVPTQGISRFKTKRTEHTSDAVLVLYHNARAIMSKGVWEQTPVGSCPEGERYSIGCDDIGHCKLFSSTKVKVPSKNYLWNSERHSWWARTASALFLSAADLLPKRDLCSRSSRSLIGRFCCLGLSIVWPKEYRQCDLY